MNRATVVYILMLVVGAGGLWLILRLGSGLTAPTDLSGVWGVGGEDPVLPRELGQTVHVDQSGRFLRLSFENGLRVDVELVNESRPEPGSVEGLELQFQGPTWSLAALGAGPQGPLIFRLEGPERHVFTVTRIPPAGDDESPVAAAPAEPPPIAATDADANPEADAP